jgi:hypothetical protein
MTFREILKQKDEQDGTKYFDELTRAWEIAERDWLDVQSEKGAPDKTFSGRAHLDNVERILNDLVPAEQKVTLRGVEIYLLLLSVLFHDIGKIRILEFKDLSDLQKKRYNLAKEIIKDLHKKYNIMVKIDDSDEKKFDHQHFSWQKIQNKYDHANLGIHESKIAEQVALIALAHHFETAKKLKNTQKVVLQDTYIEIYGPANIGLLCALLALADALDSSFKRTLPSHLLSSAQQRGVGALRGGIEGCAIDHTGRLIRVYLGSDFIDNRTHKLLLNINKTVDSINELLKFWCPWLRQAGVDIRSALISYEGQLYRKLPTRLFRLQKDWLCEVKKTTEPIISEVRLKSVCDAM